MSEAPIAQLVVVGSSAGGIEALQKLVSELPEDFSAPVVIAQHLDPDSESYLEEILARHSTLPVRTVSDEELLEAGRIFVVPSDRHVRITDSRIGLQVDSLGRPKPSVDLLLGSAAEIFGERLIAVVLTGTGNDGTDGARIVSERGGTVVVEDPGTARFAGMPGSILPNTVDIVADVDEIPRVLAGLVSGPDEAGEGAKESEELRLLLEGLREAHGVDFASYKENTIRRRLRRRMVAVECGTVGEYRRYLEEHPEEYKNLVNSFLINVTDFFRDPEHFEYLRDHVLPKLVGEAREENRGLRIWSAGCATGEEAYSLAIALTEVLGSDRGLFEARIFATDIDEDAIEFARRGSYPASSVRGLSGERLERYFDEQDGQYVVKKSIRSMIVFGEHDLSRRSPFPNMDLCVSRNVLIYFAPELQRRALQLFAYSLRNGGYLVLGKAETVSPLSEYFAPEKGQFKVYRRQGGRFLMPPLPSPPPSPAPKPEPGDGGLAAASGAVLRPGPVEPEVPQSPRSSGEDGLSRIPIGVVVVDRRYDIRAINAAARRLLAIHGVAVGEDFLHAMRDAPYAEVRAALDAAFRDGGSASTGEFALEEAASGKPRYLRLDCYPRRGEGETGLAETVLVVINDVTREARARQGLEVRLRTVRDDLEAKAREAEEEISRLKAQNERLVEANRRLEEANREFSDLNESLQAAYEESLMASEEAQAATEEVETLNEELQATNEELETLNEELQSTIEELNTTNEDLHSRSAELQEMARTRERERRASEAQRRRLQAILEQSPAAISVHEGEDLRFRLVNAAFSRLFGPSERELAGRSPSDALPEFLGRGREDLLRRVYETGEPVTERLGGLSLDRDGDGKPEKVVLDAFLAPLRDAGGEVEGVVVHLAAADDGAAPEEHVAEDQATGGGSPVEAILEAVADAVLAVDAGDGVLFANATFRDRFGEAGDAVEGDAGASLGNFAVLTENGEPMPPEEAPRARARRGEAFELRFATLAEDGTLRLFEASGRPLPGGAGGVVVIRGFSGGS